MALLDPMQIVLIGVVAILLGLVFANRLRMDHAALAIAATLGLIQYLGFGMLGPANTPKDAVKAIAGFGQPVVVTLIALFILTRSLEKSGATFWLAHRLIRAG